jgi:hypothetical protein
LALVSASKKATWANFETRSVDGQEHEELALGQAQLADVDVDVADRGAARVSSCGVPAKLGYQTRG